MKAPLPISIDLISFVLGMVAAALLLWVAARVRPLWRDITGNLKRRRQEAGQRHLDSLEEDHRRLTLRHAQGMHLAAALCPLDDILEEPRLLAPMPRVEPGGLLANDDVVTMTLPYLPAWPELAAIYGAPTFTLGEALGGGMNIAIIGQPGSGKTVALAHLACLLANRSEALGTLKDSVPFLVHVADLKLPAEEARDLITRIVEIVSDYVSVFDLGRVDAFVQSCFRSGRAVLLLDGFDELTSHGQRDATGCLKQVLHEYPKIRMVTTGAPEYLDGLMSLGFVPLALASWNSPSQARFIRRWGEIWSESQSRGARSHDQQERMDPVLLTSWIGMDNGGLTPLELTLRVWSACAHDWLGPHILESIASHIRRLAPADTPLEALETLAMQVMLTAQPIFDPRRARAWVKDFELPEEVELDAEAQPAEGQGHEAEPTTPEPRKDRMGNLPPPTPGLLGRLAATGLVIAYPQNKMRFVHPVLGGYLAGRALSGFKAEDTLLNQPDWIGKLLTMRYFAAHADAGSLVHLMLKWSRLPMHRPLLTIARWLRDAPRDASWRSTVMAALAELMQATRLPLSLRGQALAALIACGDTGVAALFRQMLNGSSDELAQLAALGSGAIRDEKAVSALEGMVQSTRPSERRAACLALVAIGTTPSLESVGHALLHGDDDLRRAAAESLANNEGEGHAMLKDGAGMADNLLRRAVVYGLGRVHQPWALELLEKARLEDEQWVVRNSANEVVEAENRAKDPRVPRPLRVPSETPWLITFAGTQGVGIAPHSPATDVLLAALKSTNAEERLAALEYLKHGPNEGVVKELYAAMFGTDAELREAAFLALWEIGASGYKLPDPTQFGLS